MSQSRCKKRQQTKKRKGRPRKKNGKRVGAGRKRLSGSNTSRATKYRRAHEVIQNYVDNKSVINLGKYKNRSLYI